MIKATSTAIPDVLIIEPQVFADCRGFLFESFNQREFNAATDTNFSFVQDNHSRSGKGVLRGLHYQVDRPQGKLVRVVCGTIFDVAVDIRPTSATYGKWVGVELSEHDNRQMWLPPGLAHGFLVLSTYADVVYKLTDYYSPNSERCIAWNDPALAVAWPISGEAVMSATDDQGQSFDSIILENKPIQEPSVHPLNIG